MSGPLFEQTKRTVHPSDPGLPWQFRESMRLAKLGYWQMDLSNNELLWSDELYELYGLDPSVKPDVTLYLSLLHPEDEAACRELLYGSDIMEEVFHTHRLIRPDGRMIHVLHRGHPIRDSHGRITGHFGVVQDVTEQKLVEEQLRINKQRFKALVQNGSDIIAVVDQNSCFTYVSPATTKIVGYEPEELVGKGVMELIHPDEIDLVRGELTNVILRINQGVPTLHRFRHKDGSWIWLESTGINRMAEADVEGVIINARDVTERKRLETQLAEEQQKRQRAITSAVIRAQEGERAQLGQELHDNVNQVLTTVKLYNEMMLDGIGEPREILVKSIRQLQNCINEIRSISKRLSAPSLGKISVADSVHELVESINLTNRLHISSRIQGLDDRTVPQEVHLAIYRIIQEQLNNILKYAEAKHAWITLVNDHRGLVLTISDDGRGFDPGTRRTGIGITNMETRAENMNGTLEVSSAPGKGCRVTACFPQVR